MVLLPEGRRIIRYTPVAATARLSLAGIRDRLGEPIHERPLQIDTGDIAGICDKSSGCFGTLRGGRYELMGVYSVSRLFNITGSLRFLNFFCSSLRHRHRRSSLRWVHFYGAAQAGWMGSSGRMIMAPQLRDHRGNERCLSAVSYRSPPVPNCPKLVLLSAHRIGYKAMCLSATQFVEALSSPLIFFFFLFFFALR